jgi:hypothetical protein
MDPDPGGPKTHGSGGSGSGFGSGSGTLVPTVHSLNINKINKVSKLFEYCKKL